MYKTLPKANEVKFFEGTMNGDCDLSFSLALSSLDFFLQPLNIQKALTYLSANLTFVMATDIN